MNEAYVKQLEEQHERLLSRNAILEKKLLNNQPGFFMKVEFYNNFDANLLIDWHRITFSNLRMFIMFITVTEKDSLHLYIKFSNMVEGDNYLWWALTFTQKDIELSSYIGIDAFNLYPTKLGSNISYIKKWKTRQEFLDEIGTLVIKSKKACEYLEIVYIDKPVENNRI